MLVKKRSLELLALFLVKKYSLISLNPIEDSTVILGGYGCFTRDGKNRQLVSENQGCMEILSLFPGLW